MMRTNFDRQLKELDQGLKNMGYLCEKSLVCVQKSLSQPAAELLQEAVETETDIDHMERDLESLCMRLLLRQQPVAADLRKVSAALKMITDMERIGDQARNIAEIIPLLDQTTGKECILVEKMAKAVIEMVHQSLEAFSNEDVKLALETIARDDEVDEYFTRIKTRLIGQIAASPDQGERFLDVLMIAKYFERIGDHAVNLANWVVFSITGEHVEAYDDLVY